VINKIEKKLKISEKSKLLLIFIFGIVNILLEGLLLVRSSLDSRETRQGTIICIRAAEADI